MGGLFASAWAFGISLISRVDVDGLLLGSGLGLVLRQLFGDGEEDVVDVHRRFRRCLQKQQAILFGICRRFLEVHTSLACRGKGGRKVSVIGFRFSS